ncbi:hypothetical protein [Cohnella fermenti]|uniref:Uncharacterized protein n=1 Tax=Cohnella fermenti TaxID=2565925 RepID=A0A4S4BKH1_9BACL|nr:hypothetical protein [Cohnella fermenti]THF74621.1 hypothetical protein E6C55_24810 [Cohnella fermenti]
MAKSMLRSSVKGALLGVTMTGGWLVADLLLPEPWGDVVLFSAMAVVNVGIGWKLGKMFDQQEAKAAAQDPAPQNAALPHAAAPKG